MKTGLKMNLTMTHDTSHILFGATWNDRVIMEKTPRYLGAKVFLSPIVWIFYAYQHLRSFLSIQLQGHESYCDWHEQRQHALEFSLILFIIWLCIWVRNKELKKYIISILCGRANHKNPIYQYNDVLILITNESRL